MSLPSPAAPFTAARVVLSWRDFPFEHLGDNTAIVYYLKCEMDSESYAALVLGTNNLTNATTAGVIETRWADANARWIGDNNFAYSDGGVVSFMRRFATVPASREDPGALVVDLPKAFVPDTNDIFRLGGPKVKRITFEYEYSSNPASFTLEDRFTVVFNSNEVDWTRASGAGATTPGSISSGAVVEATIVRRLYGDIFEALTITLT